MESGAEQAGKMSFWDHLEVLRAYILRIVLVCLAFGIAAFCLKAWLFDILLAPGRDSFVTYRLFDSKWICSSRV